MAAVRERERIWGMGSPSSFGAGLDATVLTVDIADEEQSVDHGGTCMMENVAWRGNVLEINVRTWNWLGR